MLACKGCTSVYASNYSNLLAVTFAQYIIGV